MRKFKTFFVLAIVILITAFVALSTTAEQTYTLSTGISIDKIPNELYGTWRVSSKLSATNAQDNFKSTSTDLWNLSREHDVITLSNPFSGAKASISFDEVSGKFIRFTKIGNYDGKKLTDTVQLTLEKETFTGKNTIKLDTIADDGHVIKSEWANYTLSGEKISGSSIK